MASDPPARRAPFAGLLRSGRSRARPLRDMKLRAPGKVGYVLGRFAPDEDAATALLDYAVHYAESEHGRVPFKQWPKGVKGHFITRTPPPGFVAQ